MPGEGDRTYEQGDADGDGDVDSNDATILAQDWTSARMQQFQFAVESSESEGRTRSTTVEPTDDLFTGDELSDDVLPTLVRPRSFLVQN